MQDDDEWFDKNMKSMLKRFWLIFALSTLVSIGAMMAMIYFAFWCLRHFGVISG